MKSCVEICGYYEMVDIQGVNVKYTVVLRPEPNDCPAWQKFILIAATDLNIHYSVPVPNRRLSPNGSPSIDALFNMLAVFTVYLNSTEIYELIFSQSAVVTDPKYGNGFVDAQGRQNSFKCP